DFKAMNYHWSETRSSSGKRSLLATKGNKTFSVENPIDKAKLYASEILNLYCPSVGIGFNNSPITSSAVFFSKLTSDEARQFVRKGFSNHSVSDEVIERYYPAIGYDFLGPDLAKLIPFFGMTRSKFMNEEYASDLR